MTRRSWPIALLIASGAGLAVAALGTIPFMGLPGALALAPIWPVLHLLAGGGDPFPRDSAWPFAIINTWFTGAVLPLAWMATRPLRGWVRGLAFTAAWVVLAALASLSLYAMTMPTG
jgi:hypothetical protein